MTIALAILSGFLCAASFPKFGSPALAWIALAPLIVAASLPVRPGRSWLQRPAVLGFISGMVYFGGTLYWVAGVMAMYGGLSPWLTGLITVLLVSYLAIYPAVFAWMVGRAVRSFGVRGVWLAPCFWVATEWVRGSIGGGFPWVPMGASQASVIPVVQLASVTGVYGLSALVVLVGTAAAAVSLSRRRAHAVGLVAVAALVAIVAGLGALRVTSSRLTERGSVLRVGLLQGNVAQDIKWDPAYAGTILRRYIDLSRQAIGAGAGVVIWPEASMPFFFDADAAQAEPVRRLARESRTPFVIGADESEPARDGQPGHIYNAAIFLGADGQSHGSYRKMQLVPFGEYVPMKGLLFFVRHLVEQVSDFSPGTEPVVFDIDNQRLSVAICYESAYPWISRAFVERGTQLLAVITNDAWFGRSSAAYQHFDLGAMRAVEEGRYLVRAANTGITGAVDPYGRVLAETHLFEATAITVDVRLLDGRTIYSRIGDLVVWLALAATAAFLLASRRGIVRTRRA